MSDGERLRAELARMEGRPYGQYKSLRGGRTRIGAGVWRFEHVQGDPFAAPSRVRADVDADVLALPREAFSSAVARRACADFIHRAIRRALACVRGGGGSGKSGQVEIAGLGPEVLDRTAVRVDDAGGVRVRLWVGLPARGRRILGREAARLVVDVVPGAVSDALHALDHDALGGHVRAVEDQVALREGLAQAGLVAFLAEGAVLPRRSGVDARPLQRAIPLDVPESLAVVLRAPHAGEVRGLGIPQGVTVIVGGGYHGKSTLLSTLAHGVYDHVPGDGREGCVTQGDAVSIRAEDGRAVRGVDLRPFIADLPLGRRTDRFDTDDASGSTSQAAAIMEALECGARALLIDEDTAATNFMIRDARMRRLVPSAKEPITPYLDRVRQLWEERGVSSVLVIGGAGDYLDVADTVIQMDAYVPRDVGERARAIASELPLGEAGPRAPGAWAAPAARVPDPRSLDPSRGRRAERVRSVRTRSIEFGIEEIDVAALYQLVDPAQCRFIGDVLLELSRGLCDGKRSVTELLDAIEARASGDHIEALAAAGHGDRAGARRYEIAAALNRLRSLRLRES